jgi:hypothetical protein
VPRPGGCSKTHRKYHTACSAMQVQTPKADGSHPSAFTFHLYMLLSNSADLFSPGLFRLYRIPFPAPPLRT